MPVTVGMAVIVSSPITMILVSFDDVKYVAYSIKCFCFAVCLLNVIFFFSVKLRRAPWFSRRILFMRFEYLIDDVTVHWFKIK